MWSETTRKTRYGVGRAFVLFLACVVMVSVGFAIGCFVGKSEGFLSTGHNGGALLLLVTGVASMIIAWSIARQMLDHDEPVKTVPEAPPDAIDENLPHDAAGRPSEIAGCLSDVTDPIRAERDRESQVLQRVQSAKMESIERLAGGVAHDFNNMLQAILGYAEMAMYQLPAEGESRGDIASIQQAANRAAELTRKLLVFARKSKMNREIIEMNEAVGGMSKKLKPLLGPGIVWDWEPGEAACGILVDPVQFEQIVTNLSDNARDAFEGASGGRIEVRVFKRSLTEPIDTHTGPLKPGEYAVLSFKDNGCGIPQENLPKLFEPFFTTKQKGKGTGLGLSTVYGVVKACNGGIVVHSTVGIGSTFEVFFPCGLTKAPGESSVPVEAGAPHPAGVKGKTILLVDDEETILQTTRRMLCSVGYEVLSTTSPDEAAKLVREHGRKISLLVTDVIMPDKNGIQLVAEVRAIEPGLPYLYMSGYTSNLFPDQGIQGGFSNFISKPFTRDMIVRKVVDCLEKRTSCGGNV